MSTTPAGWFPDPYGRYQQRYWDGSAWTAHVLTDSQQLVDPLGATTSIPFATPATATGGFAAPTQQFATAASGGAAPVAAAGPSGPGGIWGFLDRMGIDAKERPDPTLIRALSGLGGVLLAAGIIALVIGDEPSRGKVIGAGALVTVVALAVRLLSRAHGDTDEQPPRLLAIGSAAIGMGVVGIGTLVGGITADSDSTTLPLFIAALAYFLAWALPGFFGRGIMLALAAIALVGGIAEAVSSDVTIEDCNRAFDRGDDIPSECFSLGDDSSNPVFGVLPSGVDGVVADEGIAYLVCGGVLMGGVLLLDRRKYHGVATSLVVAGLGATLVGTAVTVGDLDGSLGALLATVVGAIVCFVGSHGERRATTWWGAGITAVGVVALVFNATEPSSQNGIAGMVILAGALLIAVPVIIAAIRDAQRKDQPTTP